MPLVREQQWGPEFGGQVSGDAFEQHGAGMGTLLW